ncbi:MAG: hypothetical protein H0W25_14285 [Acidimicrobiia bacterium]|nr:hypothetical protein [Acidimicrobiia bacterium]
MIDGAAGRPEAAALLLALDWAVALDWAGALLRRAEVAAAWAERVDDPAEVLRVL